MKITKAVRRGCLLMALVMMMAVPAAAQEAGNAPANPTVTLSGNPTTGYTWAAQAADEGVVSVVDDGFAQNESGEGVTGAGGFQRFELVGQAEGYTTVTFAYARSWETEEEPVYKLVYDVSVDAELGVTVVGTTFITGGN